MLRLEKSKFSPLKVVMPAITILLFCGGLYILISTSSPFIARQLIDPTDNNTVKLLEETKSADTIANNRVYIPKIDINLPFEAGDETVMDRSIWWRSPSSGNPSDGGNFVLSAHRFTMGWNPLETVKQSPFYNIDKLDVGDEITVDYQGERFVYIISEKYAVAPTAIEIEEPTDDNRLTLYSCTLAGASDGRDVLIAKQI